VSLVSSGQKFEANDPRNKLGRKQMIITDISRVVTQSGVVYEGMRVSKMFGPVGTVQEQADDNFMREGALFVSRSGFPLMGVEVVFKQSPDLVGSYHLPLPLHNIAEPRKYGSTYVEPDLSEAVRAAIVFDNFYFPNPMPDERVSGLSLSETVMVRAAIGQMLEQIPGL
jgi:hypothetical protein